MTYRARIETTIDGQKRSIPVLPRSRKTTVFPSQSAAIEAIDRFTRRSTIAGRALVYPATVTYAEIDRADWSQIYTMAL